MNKEVAMKWIAALRSGKFKQTRSALMEGSKGDRSYCCLGVLCAISPWKNTYNRMKDAEDGVIPPQVKEWAGMHSNSGTRPGKVESLIALNDSSGFNFSEIADVIEAECDSL